VVGAEVLPTTAPAAPPLPSGDARQAIQRALEIRPEVKRQILDQENKKIQVDYSRNQLRPLFDRVATYSQNGLGGTRIVRDYTNGFFDAPIKSIEPGGFSNALDTLFSRRFLGYVVGFNFKVALGNDEARATSAQAQIDLRQGEERLRSLRQRIALEVRDAYDRMERDRARVDAAETSVRYGEKKLEGEQDKYALGAGTTRFILEAQRDLQDARSRLLRAKIDLVKSRIALDKAVGDIFPAYNIELKEALGLFK
jgi:outer membrane protein TolC